MASVNSFEELEIWRRSVNLAICFYKITKSEALSKDYGLCDQIRRASVSVSNNIAEGFEYYSEKQFIKYLIISKGSLSELRSMLYILKELNLISDDDFDQLKMECIEIARMIASLIKYLNKVKATT